MHKRNQDGFAHFFILLLLVLVVIGGAFFLVMKNHKGPATYSSSVAGCKGQNKVSMTHMPMNIDDVSTIAPMGLTAGAHVTPIDHLYFYPQPGPRDKYPVYAMADGYLVGIEVRNVNVSNGEKRPPEFRITMQHSCRTTSYFDLVTKLDQSILDKAPDAATKGFNGRIAIKSGQEIGRIGAQSLDTAIYDHQLTLPGFIHPNTTYKGEDWKPHTDDFFAYFKGSMLSQMLAKDVRKVKPYSGKIDYDQPGKLIGNWFKEGTNGYAGPPGKQVGDSSGRGYWTGHLAIFYDAIDPSKIVVSIGDFKDGQPMAFNVVGNAPDPATIDVSKGLVKYELTDAPPGFGPQTDQNQGPSPQAQVKGTILLQVQSGEKLKVQVFPGKKAAQISGFTAASMYER